MSRCIEELPKQRGGCIPPAVSEALRCNVTFAYGRVREAGPSILGFQPVGFQQIRSHFGSSSSQMDEMDALDVALARVAPQVNAMLAEIGEGSERKSRLTYVQCGIGRL
jgi:hypothetical protein